MFDKLLCIRENIFFFHFHETHIRIPIIKNIHVITVCSVQCIDILYRFNFKRKKIFVSLDDFTDFKLFKVGIILYLTDLF